MSITLVLATAALGAGPFPAEAPAGRPRLADVAAISYAYDPAAIEDAAYLGPVQEEMPTTEPDEPTTRSGWELPPPPPFGEAGSSRWYIYFARGSEVGDSRNNVTLFGLGFSQFVDDGLSLNVEFGGALFNQRREDAGGVNFNLLFQWHFLMEPRWTLYLDGGAGVVYTNERVPPKGSTFNFTPQAGLGLTYDLGKDVRLMVGGRWLHVSNADLFEDNPGRDSIMGYVAVSLPF